MQVVINEAKEGELHTNLRTTISNRYGIDPNHKDWEHVKPHASIRKYSENVYDMFSDQIDNTQTEFHERVDDMHHDLTKGK